MRFEHIDLGAGTALHGLQTGKFKTLCIHAVAQVPLDERAPSIHLIPAILRRGTRSFPDMVALGRRSEELYGTSVSAEALRRGERMLFCFNLDLVDPSHLPGRPELLPAALELFREWILEPLHGEDGFRLDYFEQERQNQVLRIRTLLHDPGQYAFERLRAIMCAAEPYGIPPLGREEDVAALENRSTFELRAEILRTAPLDFFFVGPRPPAEIAAELRPIAAALGRGEPRRIGPPVAHPPIRELRRIEEEQPIGQGKLVLGSRIPQNPEPAEQVGMALMSAIYGGGTFSKLFREVRERRSLAYYASTAVEKDKGLLFIQAGVDASNGPAVIDLCLELLEEMRRGEFDDQVFEHARRSLLNRLGGVEDCAMDLIGFELDEVITARGWTVAGFEEAVRRATREQIVRAAAAVAPDVAYFLKPADRGLEPAGAGGER